MASTIAGDGLLERAEPLEQILRLAGDIQRTGSGRLLIVEGAPGLGKTALLAEAAERLAEGGSTVFTASGAELEAALTYGVVRQLFGHLVASGAQGPEWDGPAAVARQVLDAGVNPSATDVEPGAAMHGLLWFSASLAETGPLALIVDDAHWADASSLRWLGYLARRMTAIGVLIIVSRRPAGMHPVTDDLLSALARGADTLLVAPLSEPSTAVLLRRAVGAGVPDEICHACFAATGGNPFFVHELVVGGGAALESAPGEAIAAMATDSIARSVVRRLGALGSDAIRLARSVAVLGVVVAMRHAAALADLDYDTAELLADQLSAASILLNRRPLQFAHPIVRAAVYNDMTPGARSNLHRRAAKLLHDDSADPMVVGTALLSVEPYGDAWACARLREAAAAARAHGDLHSAAIYLDRALREPPSPDERGDVLLELGIAERQALGAGAVDHLRAAWQLAAQPARRGRIAFELTRALTRPKDVAEARKLIDVTLPTLTKRPALAALLETNRIGLASLHLTGEPPDLTIADGLLDRLEPGERAARLLRAVCAADSLYRGRSAGDLQPQFDAALADDADQLAGDLGMSSYVAFAAMLAERFDAAEKLLGAVLEKAQRLGSPFAAGHVWCFRSHLFLRLGRVGDAEADARQALDALEGYPLAPIIPLPVAALLERDQPREALSLLQRSGGAGELPPWLPGLVMTIGRIPLWVAVGEPERAMTDLATAERLVTDAGYDTCVALPWRAEGALACVAIGDMPRARALADEQLRLAREFGAPGALGAALRVAGLVRGADGGLELLEDAVDTLATTPMRLEHAKALAAFGAAQRRAGHRATARDTLARALDIADACGAITVAKQAREELLIAGARPRRERLSGTDALTTSELRIARLAARHATNAQIAQSLFLTPKTVEHHLTSVYAKLGISSRNQLGGALVASETS